MSPPEEPEISAESGQRSLLDHAREKAAQARLGLDEGFGYAEFLALLEDRSVVRYPTTIRFDAAPLAAGMFAVAQQVGERPEAGFVLYVHPYFEHRPLDLPLLIAYHLVVVNYGEVADAQTAEAFGATLLGLDVEDYYQTLCRLADELVAAQSESGDQ